MVLLLVLSYPCLSSANTGSVYGLGTVAPAMGNAYTAYPDDASAVYYNPAGLALEKGNAFSLGLSYFYPVLWTKGSDGITDYRDNDRVLGLTVGMDANLGHMTGYRQLSMLSFGLLLYTPPDRAYSVHAVPADDPSFTLYKDTASQLMLMIGMGYRVTSFLQIGASVLLSMPGKMRTLYYLDTGTSPPDAVLIENRRLTIGASPEIGLILEPADTFHVGAAYRARNSSGLTGETTFIINGTPELSQTDDEKIVTTPDQIAVGVSVTPTAEIRVNADATYSVWSDRDVTDTQGNAMGASDTITPAIGIEYRPVHTWALRTGYSYAPSPFPPQSGATNYVDSSKNIFSLGAGYMFHWLGSGIRTSVDAFLQLQALTERNNGKTPSFMSYTNGGLVWSSGISLTFHL